MRGHLRVLAHQFSPIYACWLARRLNCVLTPSSSQGGSVSLRLVPAPKGAGIVAASTPKKVLAMAGIHDVYTASQVRPVPFPSLPTSPHYPRPYAIRVCECGAACHKSQFPVLNSGPWL